MKATKRRSIRISAAALATGHTRRFHETVAREERSHAELGWSIVRWGLVEGGRPVHDALRRLVAARLDFAGPPAELSMARAVERRARRRLRRWLATVRLEDEPTRARARQKLDWRST